MQTRNIFLLIIINLTFICCFISCKKYPEDGKYSWHKPDKRILGVWYLKEFMVDGVDSAYKWYEKKTGDITDTIKWQLINTRLIFDDVKDKKSSEGKTVDVYDDHVYVNNSLNWFYSYFHSIGKWSFENKKYVLFFDSNYDYKKQNVTIIKFSIFGSVTDYWYIKKLTDKEMILEAYGNTNKQLRIKFQRQ